MTDEDADELIDGLLKKYSPVRGRRRVISDPRRVHVSTDVCPICAMLGGTMLEKTMRYNRPISARPQTVSIMDQGHWTCDVCRTYMADPARSALMLSVFGVENFDNIENKEQLASLLDSDNAVQSKRHLERRAVEGLQFILFGTGNES